MSSPLINPKLKHMRCIKCGRTYPVGDYFYGCPSCLENGQNANLTFVYEKGRRFQNEKMNLARYSQFLPYVNTPYLGEGHTPILELTSLAKELGYNKIYSKNEFQNPTGSHKDRMNPFIVARARQAGYHTVTCASSGNEAASLAAYAAASGLSCVNVSTKNISSIWRMASESCGASLILTETPADRLRYQRNLIKEGLYCATNLLDIPTGSSPYGIQGYKTISFEIYEHFGRTLPEYIMIPTCRGDLLYGIYEGFMDLIEENMISSMPRLIAAEPFPRLERILSGECRHQDTFIGDSSSTPSIGGNTATYQSELALKNSDGFAVSASDENVWNSVKTFGQQGLYLETSSALLQNCLKIAQDRRLLSPKSSLLLILTSSGYKNNPTLFA